MAKDMKGLSRSSKPVYDSWFVGSPTCALKTGHERMNAHTLNTNFVPTDECMHAEHALPRNVLLCSKAHRGLQRNTAESAPRCETAVLGK
jgi:hypothetical protein